MSKSNTPGNGEQLNSASSALMANPTMSRRAFFSLTAAVGALSFLGSATLNGRMIVSAYADEDENTHFQIYLMAIDEVPVQAMSFEDGEWVEAPGVEVTLTSLVVEGQSVTVTTDQTGFAAAGIKPLSWERDVADAAAFSCWACVTAKRDGYREWCYPEYYVTSDYAVSDDGTWSNTIVVLTLPLSEESSADASSNDASFQPYLYQAALDGQDVLSCAFEQNVGASLKGEHTLVIQVCSPNKHAVTAEVLTIAPDGTKYAWVEKSNLPETTESAQMGTMYRAEFKGEWLVSTQPGSKLLIKFSDSDDRVYTLVSPVMFAEAEDDIDPDSKQDGDAPMSDDSLDSPLPSWLIRNDDSLNFAMPDIPIKIFSDKKGNFGLVVTLLSITFLKRRDGVDALEDADKVKTLASGLSGENFKKAFKKQVQTGLALNSAAWKDKENSLFGRSKFTTKWDASFDVQFFAYGSFDKTMTELVKAKTWRGNFALGLSLGISASATSQLVIVFIPLALTFDFSASISAKIIFGFLVEEGLKNFRLASSSSESGSSTALASNDAASDFFSFVVVIHVEIGLSLAVGIAGVLDAGVRGSAYLRITLTYDDSYEGAKPLPRAMAELGAAIDVFVEVLFWKKTFNVAELSPKVIADNWSDTSSNLLADELAVSELDMSDATLVTDDTLALSAEYEGEVVTASALSVSEGNDGSEDAPSQATSMEYHRIRPTGATANAALDISPYTRGDFGTSLSTLSDEASTTYNPLYGLKPTWDDVLYKDVYSAARPKVIHGYKGFEKEETVQAPTVSMRLATVVVSDAQGNRYTRTRVAYSVWDEDNHKFGEEKIIDFKVDGLDAFDRYDVDFDFDMGYMAWPYVAYENQHVRSIYVAITSLTRPNGVESNEDTLDDYKDRQFVTLVRIVTGENIPDEWHVEDGAVTSLYSKDGSVATWHPRVLVNRRAKIMEGELFNYLWSHEAANVYYYRKDLSTGDSDMRLLGWHTEYSYDDRGYQLASNSYLDHTLFTGSDFGISSSDLTNGTFEVYSSSRNYEPIWTNESQSGNERCIFSQLCWQGRNTQASSSGTQGKPLSVAASLAIKHNKDEDGYGNPQLQVVDKILLDGISSISKRTVHDDKQLFVFSTDTAASEERFNVISLNSVLEEGTAVDLGDVCQTGDMKFSVAQADGYTTKTNYFASSDGRWLYCIRVAEGDLQPLHDDALKVAQDPNSQVYSTCFTDDDTPEDLGDGTMAEGGKIQRYQILESRWVEEFQTYNEFYPIAQLEYPPSTLQIIAFSNERRDFEVSTVTDTEKSIGDIHQVGIENVLGTHVIGVTPKSKCARAGDPVYLDIDVKNTGNWFITSFDVSIYYGSGEKAGTLVSKISQPQLSQYLQVSHENYKQVLDADGNPVRDEDGKPKSQYVQDFRDTYGILWAGMTRRYRFSFTMPDDCEHGYNEFYVGVDNPTCSSLNAVVSQNSLDMADLSSADINGSSLVSQHIANAQVGDTALSWLGVDDFLEPGSYQTVTSPVTHTFAVNEGGEGDYAPSASTAATVEAFGMQMPEYIASSVFDAVDDLGLAFGGSSVVAAEASAGDDGSSAEAGAQAGSVDPTAIGVAAAGVAAVGAAAVAVKRRAKADDAGEPPASGE